MDIQSKSAGRALSVALSLVAALVAGRADAGPDRDRHEGRHDRRPAVIVEPNIIIDRRREPDLDAPEIVMAELGRCRSAGVRLFVDCLRHTQRAMTIRRLEACVRSETIPDEPERVEACLPLIGRP